MIVALMNYNRAKRFVEFDTLFNTLDYSKTKALDNNFLNIKNRGYYTKSLLFGLTAFYRKNEVLYLYKGREIDLTDCTVEIVKHPVLSFIKKLNILNRGKSIKKVFFVERKNYFENDFTMARGNIDLNLCYLIYYILSDKSRRAKFLETGYYD